MRQPSLQSVVASCNDKNKAADDTVFAFTGAGIPLYKLDHPLVRAWLHKDTTIAGCLPQGSSDFPIPATAPPPPPAYCADQTCCGEFLEGSV